MQATFAPRNRLHGKDRKQRGPSTRTHRTSATPSASDVQRQEPPPRQRPQAAGTVNLQPSEDPFCKRRSLPGTTSTAKTASIGDRQPALTERARPLRQATFNDRNYLHGKDRKQRGPSTFNPRKTLLQATFNDRNYLHGKDRKQRGPSTFNPQPSTLQPLTRAPLPIRCQITLLDRRHVARHLDHLEDLLVMRGYIHSVQGIA